MITPDQEAWLDHLSTTQAIQVVPFDPTCEEKFLQTKEKVQAVLGFHQAVEHHGASSLGISGQDEIDVYVPVFPDEFDGIVIKLKSLFGEPGSLYPLQRARFTTNVSEKRVDVFVVNKNHQNWRDTVVFENYLHTHSDALEEYRSLKESLSGKSVQEYYRRKTEFINGILALTL